MDSYVKSGGATNPGEIMKCFSPAQLPVLNALAREYAVCDGWRASMPGPTWPNRFFMMAASSGGLDHSPSVEQIAEWMTVDGFGFEHGNPRSIMRCPMRGRTGASTTAIRVPSAGAFPWRAASRA